MSFVKKLAVILILCIIFRVSYALGADVALDSYIQSAVKDNDLITNTLVSQSPFLMANKESDKQNEEEQSTAEANLLYQTEPEEEETQITEEASTDEPDESGEEIIPDTSDSSIKEKTITGGDGYLSADGIFVKNYTTYDINIAASLNKDSTTSLQIGAESPQVLIIHTHGSEAYVPNGNYEESDSYRTQNKEYSVIKVGDELVSALESQGISVIHDREIYDYPSYIGSYGRSLTAATSYVKQYPSIQVIIDLHRDALMEDDGTVYKTVAEINGETCAQVMLVVGTNGTGLSHDGWSNNFSLATKLQASMNEKYPTLARPISLREERFNQHLSSGALLLEVGTNGNTIEEAIKSVGYFADCLGDVLLTE